MKNRKNRPRYKNPITGSGVVMLALIAAGGFVAYMLWKKRDTIMKSLNPASTENLIYRATGSVVQTATGDPTASLGTKIADWLKSDAEKAVDKMLATKPPDLTTGSYYDLGAKPPPTKVFNPSGTLTSSEYRDLVR